MSQNNNSNNDSQNQPNRSNRIRGPTSALTSFLREHGIHVNNTSRRARRSQAAQETVVVEDDDDDPMQGVEATTSSTTTSLVYTPKKTRNTKPTVKGDTKKKKRKDDSDSDFEDSDDDFSPSSSRKAVPSRARIVFCVQCKCRFARKVDENDHLVCPDCTAGTFSKPKPVKRKIAAIKKDTLPKEHLPSLQDLCISVIAEYIDDVEAFGVISESSTEKLAKIISRNRKLNDQTSRLFMEPVTRRLSLYDCTNMNEVALYNIAQFCPRMQHLFLDYCGHMTNKVIEAYAEKLHMLKSLEVSGAYLVTVECWQRFFEAMGDRLVAFQLRHSARFDTKCVQVLSEQCPNLTKLKLSHLFNMKSDWLAPLASLQKLTNLELAWPEETHPFKTEDVVNLLQKIGPQLTELSIKGGRDLDDNFLSEGLSHCTNLKKLNIEQCDKLTSGAMVDLLQNWTCHGLVHLDISRCILFDDQVLMAVIRHSGETLQHLNIHSLELLTSAALDLLGGGPVLDQEVLKPCKQLIYLDCGFVRSVDDFVLQKVVTECEQLKHVQVWGCYSLTENAKFRGGVNVTGRELAYGA